MLVLLQQLQLLLTTARNFCVHSLCDISLHFSGASVHLELNIQDYKVEHLVMYLEGGECHFSCPPLARDSGFEHKTLNLKLWPGGDAKMQYDVSLQPQYFHASLLPCLKHVSQFGYRNHSLTSHV